MGPILTKEDTKSVFTLMGNYKNKTTAKRKPVGYISKQSTEQTFATTTEDVLNIDKRQPNLNESNNKGIINSYASVRTLSPLNGVPASLLKKGYKPPLKQQKTFDEMSKNIKECSLFNEVQSLVVPNEASLNNIMNFTRDLQQTIIPEEDVNVQVMSNNKDSKLLIMNSNSNAKLKLQQFVRTQAESTLVCRNLKNLKTEINDEETKINKIKPILTTPKGTDISLKNSNSGSINSNRKGPAVISPYHIRKNANINKTPEENDTDLQPLASRLSAERKRNTMPTEQNVLSATKQVSPFETASPLKSEETLEKFGTMKLKNNRHILMKANCQSNLNHPKDIRVIKAKSTKNMEKISENEEQSGGDNSNKTGQKVLFEKVETSEKTPTATEICKSESVNFAEFNTLEFDKIKKKLNIMDNEIISLFPKLRLGNVLLQPKLAVPEILYILPDNFLM